MTKYVLENNQYKEVAASQAGDFKIDFSKMHTESEFKLDMAKVADIQLAHEKIKSFFRTCR